VTRNTSYKSNRSCAASRLFLSLGLCAIAVSAAPAGPSRVELAGGWRLASAGNVQADGSAISAAGFSDSGWYPIHRMPATVLEILQEDGVYTDLYIGKNLLEKVPQDLYRQDWWYRTTFTAPAGSSAYTLEFPGINYRAEIWLNGKKIADNKQVAGMYAAHQFDVTRSIRAGAPNGLAVKVTPEQLVQDADGVELADSWFDWINWKYVGYHGAKKNPGQGVSFVPDRNAGVWKPVYLRST
jgi:exo-1,4-beta-D-glucosaminidase